MTTNPDDEESGGETINPKEYNVDFRVDMPIADFREQLEMRLLTSGIREKFAGFPEAWKAKPTHPDYQYYAAYAPGDNNTTHVFVTFRVGYFFGPKNADIFLVNAWGTFPSARPDLRTVIDDPEMAWLLPKLARLIADDTKSEREPINVVARRLKRHPRRIARWYRILDKYLPQGFTQEQIADAEVKDIETIKDDYRDMREGGLFPLHSPP